MQPWILEVLRCPECGGTLAVAADQRDSEDPGEIVRGRLTCPGDHVFPIIGGIPRFVDNATRGTGASRADVVRGQVRESFSREWKYHQLGDRTWYTDLPTRVGWFPEQVGMPASELRGKVVLDAGCGNGTLSVACTHYGVKVVGMDLSSGLELGERFRRDFPRGSGRERAIHPGGPHAAAALSRKP